MCTDMYEDDKKLLVGKPSAFPDRENSAADVVGILFFDVFFWMFNIQLGYVFLNWCMKPKNFTKLNHVLPSLWCGPLPVTVGSKGE